MNTTTPAKAFKKLTKELGIRVVAVGVYHIITSINPLIVLKGTQHAQLFKSILQNLISWNDICSLYPDDPTDSPLELTVLGRENYKQHWRNFLS